MSDSTQRLPLLYIIGSGRSGSTVLSRLLGAHPDIVSVGELLNYRQFFESAAERGRQCSCGSPLLECSHWKRVREATRESCGETFPDLKSDVDGRFASANRAVIHAVREVSGARLVLDTSKRYDRLRMLRSTRAFDISVIHLIRDPRAYGYSSLLTELRKGQGPDVLYRKLSRWQNKNLWLRAEAVGIARYQQVRYEDLVRFPEATLSRILDNLGLDRVDDLVSAANVAEQHEFSGNSGVFSQSALKLDLDRRYLTQLTSRQWRAATLMTLPGLLAFRYPLTRNEPRAPEYAR